MCRIPFALLALLLALPGSVQAVDGVLEINQTCAENTGCSGGDTGGFPVDLSAPGSYRLTSNLVVPDENTTAISISVGRVSVDLNGFEIRGVTTCSGGTTTCAPLGTGDGIGVTSTNLEGIEVRNGTVTGMGDDGVDVGRGARIENVRAVQNGGEGISADSASLVTGCAARRNGQFGIVSGLGSTISNSVASQNREVGILTSGSTVFGNSAFANDAGGISGGSWSTVRANSAHQNGVGGAFDDGIICGTGCLIEGNSVSDNSGVGVRLNAATSGYRANVTDGNSGGTVSGGTDLGNNLLN